MVGLARARREAAGSRLEQGRCNEGWLNPPAPAAPAVRQLELPSGREVARLKGVGAQAHGLVFWDKWALTLDSQVLE